MLPSPLKMFAIEDGFTFPEEIAFSIFAIVSICFLAILEFFALLTS
jgi:hypothetical protein